MSKRTTITTCIAIGMGILCRLPAASADPVPPRYAVTILDVLLDGGTQANALNDLGQTTGKSGVGQTGIGWHAFLGQPDGSVENIETVPGFELSQGFVINNSGHIAGSLTWFPGQSGESTIFYYTPDGGMIDIGTLGGTNGRIEDINEAGDVVGAWNNADEEWHAFMYTIEGGLIDLGILGDYESRARDINESRQVVGYSWTFDWDIHAFLWEDGVMQDLGTLGGDWSEAYYINNDGVVVGQAKDANGVFHAFRYSAEQGMVALPDPPGAVSCGATWISDSGLTFGWWTQPDGMQRGFYHTDQEGTVDLGVDMGSVWWAGPAAANQSGQTALVLMDDQTYETFGYLYDPPTGVHSLDDLFALPTTMQISSVADINESGQIIGEARDNPPYYTDHYSVLLTPITPGDLDADGDVDLSDLGELLAHFGASGVIYSQGDIDGDDDVDLADLAILLSVFGAVL